MELKTNLNEYKEKHQGRIYFGDSMFDVTATSYGWWKYVATDSVGNVFFCDYNYSMTTNKVQWQTRSILRRLGIKIAVTLYSTNDGFNYGIESALNQEIKHLRRSVLEYVSTIKKKGSWKSKNEERKADIKRCLFRIKDLRNYRDNFLDKKKIKTEKCEQGKIDESRYCRWEVNNGKLQEDQWRMLTFKQWFFRKNGKFDSHGYNELLKRLPVYRVHKAPKTIWNIKRFFGLSETHSMLEFLIYPFTQNVNDGMPEVDSKEYLQLKTWCKRHGIDKNNLNTFTLDKIHTYMVNKENRRTAPASEPKAFPVHPRLIELRNELIEFDQTHLRLIKTDRELRAEGRSQNHCIGKPRMGYLKKCFSGYQALNFKGYTFFLCPDLKVIEAHGKHNSVTPSEIQKELIDLIAA